MKNVINGSAREVLFRSALDGFAVVTRPQRNHGKPWKDALSNDAFTVCGEQPGLERQRGERGEEFCEGVGRYVALRGSRFHGLQAGERKGVLRVLLEKRRNQSGGVKTDLQNSKSAKFRASGASLLFQQRSDIPGRWWNCTRTNKNPILLGE